MTSKNSNSDAEQRAAAILLPGKELEEVPSDDSVEEVDADVIRINGKLYIKADREKKEYRTKATTGSDVMDTMLKVVGQEIAKANNEVERLTESYQIPTAERKLTKLKKRKLKKKKVSPRTVKITNLSPSAVSFVSAGQLSTLSSGATVSLNEDDFRDDRNKRLVAAGLLQVIPGSVTAAGAIENFAPSLPDSITMKELSELQRAVEWSKRTPELPVRAEVIQRAIETILARYNISPDEYSINLATGEFIRNEKLNPG